MTELKWAMLALIIAWAIVWFGMPKFLPVLRNLHFGQAIREEGPQSHLKKSGTPTMGGILIQVGVLVSVIILSILRRSFIWFPLVGLLGFGLIGFVDDFLIVKRRTNDGLRPKQKLVLQFVVAAVMAVVAYLSPAIGSALRLPFTGTEFDLGLFYLPFTFFAIVAMVNAVNLTDGLDGLASGVTAIVCVFFLAASLMLGNEGSTLAAAAVVGACLGFLGHNSNPADVFMGDTGSMALGGIVVALAIMTKLQIFLVIVGLIYVAEALSVVLQVTYFKRTGGKRLFRMTPIHHHFELGGWAETRVVAVFYVVAAVCVAVAFLVF